MGLPVTVYRHTDVGAPQLSSCTPSEWINILKKVLVDGYGDKTPLGWTIAFEDAATFAIAFRSSTQDGVGGYVQFSSISGTNGGETDLKITTAPTMVGLNSFTRPSWSRLLNLITTAKGWEIIGTTKGFWLIQHRTTTLLNSMNTTGSVGQCAFFIGEIESFYPNDPSRFVLYTGDASNSDSSSSSYSSYIGNTTTTAARMYDLDGGGGDSMYSSTTAITFVSSNTVDNGDAEVLGFQHILSPMILRQANNANIANLNLPPMRGKIPGLLVSSFGGYGNQNWPKELTLNGHTHVLMRGYLSNSQWINTEVWYG